MKTFAQEDNNLVQHMKDYLTNYEHLPCGIAVVKSDSQATVAKANSKFYQLIGHTPEQFMDKHKNQLMEILIDDVYYTIEKQSMDKDYDIQWDLRVRTADNQVRWLHDAAHYDAKLDLFFIMITDITDKMIATTRSLSFEAFQTRNEILSYVNNYTSEHIVISDLETDDVVYMNPAVAKLLGFYYESDWKGKKHWEIGFGCKENIDPVYNQPLYEDKFTYREYYNHFHKIHIQAKSKIITVAALNRKMRLDVITDVTAQMELKQRVEAQNVLHNCVDALFTASAKEEYTKSTYDYILNQLKEYYQADGAFVYKFKEGTHEVDAVYKILAEGVKSAEFEFPMIMSDEQIAMMQAISNAKPCNHKNILDSLDSDYAKKLAKIHAEYEIENFSCVAVNDGNGNILAFLGVSNPRVYRNKKNLMELLSRFICMFIEHKHEAEHKAEDEKLEAISKVKIVELTAQSYKDLSNPKETIENTLDELCKHYDADFALVLMEEEDGSCKSKYVGGTKIPDITGLDNQPRDIMERWVKEFEEYPETASDVDFVDLTSTKVKRILNEKFGIHNFIVAPIKNTDGKIHGLLFVNNFKLMNRSRLLVHGIANGISEYLAKIHISEKNHLEPATKLTNKVATQKFISKLLQEGHEGTLFILDIDNFKELNDNLGHNVGDQAIVDIAEILKKLFRSTDVIGRIGGDEFMVFSPGLTSDDLILEKLKQLVESCNLRYEKDGNIAEISASIGICKVDDSCRKFKCLYENADNALYESKNKGKNQYNIYKPC